MQTEKKREAGNVHNYGSHPPVEKVKVVRKSRTMEITSRYKSSIASPSPLVTPAGNRRNPSPLSLNPSPARQPPSAPSSRQSSPVRKDSIVPSSCAKGPSESVVRHPSPNLGRSSNASEVLKRSYSTERRRPWPAVSPPSEKKTTSLSSTTEGLTSSVKAPPLSKGPELWPSMSAAKQSADSNEDSVSSCQAKRGREKETTGKHPNHTLKPAGNGNGTAHVPGTPCRKGSPMRRQCADQAEIARPTENSHSKLDHQRWPGMRRGKNFGGNMTRSTDLTVERKLSLVRSPTMTGQSRPVTPLSRTKSISSRSFNRSANDGPIATPGQVALRRNPSPSRSRTGTTESAAQVSVASSDSDDVHPCSNTTFQGDHATHARRLSQESVATVDSLSVPLENMSDTESVSSGSSAPEVRVGRGATIPARVWQDMSNRLRRFSEGGRNRSSGVDLPAVAIVPVKTIRRTKVLPHQSAASMLMNQSMNGSTSSWALSPGRVSGNSAPSTPHPPSSPSHSKGTSPSRGLPSPQRSRPVNGSAAALAGTARNFAGTTLNFGIDGRSRGKKALTQQEEAQLLRILHNRWLQWRFVNARAEAVTRAQKATAERQLYYVWVKTSELRTSVAMQRIKLQQARQAHKLRSILSTHATHLEDWETVEEEHSNALTGCMEALESAILRVPVTGGARVRGLFRLYALSFKTLSNLSHACLDTFLSLDNGSIRSYMSSLSELFRLPQSWGYTCLVVSR
uniref:Uncharacterized protein n=1 Tax=Physcomitrium patens TaxID=3218 RepID=A0A7I4FUZ7_PHYPA